MRLVPATFLCLSAASGAALAVHAQAPATDGAVVHVVLFDLPEGASAEDARALAEDSRRLRDIPGVESVSVGPKALDDRDAHVKDYDVALCVRLRSLADLKAYGPHPLHRELVEKWKGRAAWRVIDFFDR